MNNKIFKIAPFMFCFGTLIGCNNNPPAPDPKDPELVSIEVGKTPYCSKDVDLLKEDIEIRGTYNDGTNMRIYDWTCDDKNFFDEDGKHRWGTETSKTLNIESNGKKCVLTISSIADNFSGKVSEIQWKRLIANLFDDCYNLKFKVNDIETINIDKYANITEEKIDIRSHINIYNFYDIYEQYYKDYYWTISNDQNESVEFLGNNSSLLQILNPIYIQYHQAYDSYKFDIDTNSYINEQYGTQVKFVTNNITKKLNVSNIKTNKGEYVFDYVTTIDPSSWKTVNNYIIDTKFSKNDKGINTFSASKENIKTDKYYYFIVEPQTKDQDAFNKDTEKYTNNISFNDGSQIVIPTDKEIYKNTNKLVYGENEDYNSNKDNTLYFYSHAYKSTDSLIFEYSGEKDLAKLNFNFSYNIPAEK